MQQKRTHFEGEKLSEKIMNFTVKASVRLDILELNASAIARVISRWLVMSVLLVEETRARK